jgi:hypothetical protein
VGQGLDAETAVIPTETDEFACIVENLNIFITRGFVMMMMMKKSVRASHEVSLKPVGTISNALVQSELVPLDLLNSGSDLYLLFDFLRCPSLFRQLRDVGSTFKLEKNVAN